MINKVLLVDDDASVREALGQTLDLGGCQPVLAASVTEAKDHLSANFPGVVLSDIRMPGKDGFDLLAHIRALDSDLPVILLTGEGDVPTAVRGISEGAYDFLEKPCDPKHLLDVVARALKTRKLVLENRQLKRQLESALQKKIGFLGQSEAAVRTRDAIRRAAGVAAPVLISGARGSGRGHVARLVLEARQADRQPSPAFHRLDCLSPMGFAVAGFGDGPVLLCNIERLEPGDQAGLLRCITASDRANIFATTGPDPENLVQSGALDDELFYALGVVRIHVPALPERREDVPILFDKFLREEIDAGAPLTANSGRVAAEGLAGFDWMGDLRALRNHAKRVAWGLTADAETPGLRGQLERVERALIEACLRRYSGHATATAEALGLPRKTFYDRLQKLAIRPEDFRE